MSDMVPAVDQQPEAPETHWAAALQELGLATGTMEQLEEELPSVLDALTRREDLARFLADPAVKPEGKLAALEELLSGQVHRVLLDFLGVVLRQQVWERLPAIVHKFFELASRRMEAMPGEVLTARPLLEAQRQRLEACLAELVGGRVRLHVHEDPRLLGGVVVKIGDVVMDGSVARQLEAVREALLA